MPTPLNTSPEPENSLEVTIISRSGPEHSYENISSPR